MVMIIFVLKATISLSQENAFCEVSVICKYLIGAHVMSFWYWLIGMTLCYSTC